MECRCLCAYYSSSNSFDDFNKLLFHNQKPSFITIKVYSTRFKQDKKTKSKKTSKLFVLITFPFAYCVAEYVKLCRAICRYFICKCIVAIWTYDVPTSHTLPA